MQYLKNEVFSVPIHRNCNDESGGQKLADAIASARTQVAQMVGG